jgi:hypothetical protein
MIPTARVQRGPSEAARCASKGIVPATPLIFQHPDEGYDFKAARTSSTCPVTFTFLKIAFNLPV